MKNRFKNRVEMILFEVTGFFIRLLPIFLRYFLAEVLGVSAYFLSRKRREITLSNLDIAFPDKSIKEKKVIAIESYKHLSKNLFELFWKKPLAKVENINGIELLHKLYSKDRGVIIVTLHIGNWEVGSEFVGLLGYPAYAVAKKQRNRLFNDMINKRREKNGVKIIQLGKNSGRELFKALRGKGILALGADQFSRDVDVSFFGRKTGAAAGPALLSAKFDAPVVFAYQLRDKKNNHSYYISNEIEIIKTGDEAADMIINTQKYVYEMEKIIKAYPEQWFWQHRRWRE